MNLYNISNLMLKSKSNTFVTNENKGMLWGLLQESNVFDGIENEKFKNIQNMFEDTIDAINKSNTQLSLLEKNKMTMETLLKRISDEKSKPKKNIQMIYKAEDLQDKRQHEFNIKLKEHQESMNSLINPSKPKEVSFSDETNNEDKPIGDEMDRLIAERLASRERELEIPSITKEAEEWLSNNGNNSNIINSRINNSSHNTNNNSNNKEAILEKRVSFNKDIENEITDTYRQKTPINRVNTTIQNNLFNKLKRKTNEIPLDIVDTPNTPTTAPDRITDIEENIKLLKDNQEKILSMCSQILYILQENKE